MPTGFHPNTHFLSAHLELAVELLRFLAVPQSPFVPFPSVCIYKRDLLEARVIVTTYNDHVRLLSPEPWLVSATKVYSGAGADIVMESFGASRLSVNCRPDIALARFHRAGDDGRELVWRLHWLSHLLPRSSSLQLTRGNAGSPIWPQGWAHFRRQLAPRCDVTASQLGHKKPGQPARFFLPALASCVSEAERSALQSKL